MKNHHYSWVHIPACAESTYFKINYPFFVPPPPLSSLLDEAGPEMGNNQWGADSQLSTGSIIIPTQANSTRSS